MARYKIEVRSFKPLDTTEDDVVTLSEAAKRLGISINSVAGLIARGQIQRVIDTAEPNPTQATRILASQLAGELAKRRKRTRRQHTD